MDDMGSAASNDAVRAQLAAMGDDGSAVRHVLHYAYPLDPDKPGDREKIANDLRARGLEVKDAVQEGGLVMEHHRDVAAGEFDAFTAELHAFFKGLQWDYDGWECALVARNGGNA